MGFDIVKESYSGAVREIAIGTGDTAVKTGGQSCYPFYRFEGDMPNKPRIAMEIWDMAPTDWPASAMAPFKDVAADPAAWARKCVSEFGAEMIVLQLKSTDPNDKNTSPADAAATVRKVAGAIHVPLIVWGTSNVKKDEEVLKKISEECRGMNLTLGPVEDDNHKGIGASAMGFGHLIISSSPIDVNLAKQVNILLENLGVPMDRVIIDPTTGGLGYGLEYAYSVIERLRMAAIVQNDDKLQNPVINNLANEVWKSKEARQTANEAPTLGDPEKRGILMEAVGAVAYLMAGSDILIMRHPEAIRLVKSYIDLVFGGGSAKDVGPIRKRLDNVVIDLSALSPAPDLNIGEETKPGPAAGAKSTTQAKAKDKPASVEKVHAGAKIEPAKKAEPSPKAETQPVAAVRATSQPAPAPVPKSEAKPGAVRVAKSEAKPVPAPAPVVESAAVHAGTAGTAQADARAAEENRKHAEEVAGREAEVDAIRRKRAAAREERLSGREKEQTKRPSSRSMTPAVVQKTMVDRMIDALRRTHRRSPA